MSVEILPLLGGAAAFSIVVTVFAVALRRRDERLPWESDALPEHREICGGRFGIPGAGEGWGLGGNYTYPFVRAVVYSDQILISYWHKLVIPYRDIDNIELRRHLLGRGLHIHHRDPQKPTVILWSFEPDRMMAALGKHLPPEAIGPDARFEQCACGW